MKCAIFEGKQADLKYATDLLAFAHIAPSNSLSPPTLARNMIKHFPLRLCLIFTRVSNDISYIGSTNVAAFACLLNIFESACEYSLIQDRLLFLVFHAMSALGFDWV